MAGFVPPGTNTVLETIPEMLGVSPLEIAVPGGTPSGGVGYTPLTACKSPYTPVREFRGDDGKRPPGCSSFGLLDSSSAFCALLRASKILSRSVFPCGPLLSDVYWIAKSG